MTPTAEPGVWIEDRGVLDGVAYVVYRRAGGERWRIDGTCTACGICEPPDAPYLLWDPAKRLGEPGAALHVDGDDRLDVPVTPHVNKVEGCALTGRYLP